MPSFKVVLLEDGYASINLEKEIIEKEGGTLIDADKLPLSEGLKLCEHATGILVRRAQLTARHLETFKRCKIIVRYGVGVDNIDLQAATKLGIIVGHVPCYCLDEVSAHALGLLLACTRKILATYKKMEQGGWDVHRHEPIYRLAGKTLGLIGLGNIGTAVAEKIRGWKLTVLAADPYIPASKAAGLGIQLVSCGELLARSDFISLHLPLLPETRHLMDATAFGRMKTGAILINTARGAIVDESALLGALESGKLAAAGLDVFEEEPLPANSLLRSHPKVVITDHTSWYSEESQMELQKTAAEEVVRACTGSIPLAIANPEVLHILNRFAEWTPTQTALWQMRRFEKLPTVS